MATSRSRAELLALRIEAERLVRDGVSRAEVSRLLGVHLQTLAQWALAGGWRKKDIEAETNVADACATLGRIEAARDALDAETSRNVRLKAATHAAVHRSAEEVAEGHDAALELIRQMEGAGRLAGPAPSSAHPREGGDPGAT